MNLGVYAESSAGFWGSFAGNSTINFVYTTDSRVTADLYLPWIAPSDGGLIAHGTGTISNVPALGTPFTISAGTLAAGTGSQWPPTNVLFNYTTSDTYLVVDVTPSFFSVHLMGPIDIMTRLDWNFTSTTQFGIGALVAVDGVNNTVSLQFNSPEFTFRAYFQDLNNLNISADATMVVTDATHW
jgi:hypothetical protein